MLIKNTRILSLDFSRAIVVILLFFSQIPKGPLYNSYITHSQWFGVTPVDFIFPAYVTLFGIGLALACQKGVKWKRLFQRTFLFIFLGLIYNSLELWQYDLDQARFTGVLQLFAAVGMLVVLITRLSSKWYVTFLCGIIILAIYQYVLLVTSPGFPGGLPSPFYNLSAIFDPLIFTNSHIYVQGKVGYDPEGIFSILSATGNALIGYATGQIIMQKNHRRFILIILVIIGSLFFLTWLFSFGIPVCKRLWTPSFAALTSGSTLLLLTLSYIIWDTSDSQLSKVKAIIFWGFEAIGRNAILLYFGVSILNSILYHINITIDQYSISIFQVFYSWLASWCTDPQLCYAIIISSGWTLLAFLLHWRKIYVRL